MKTGPRSGPEGEPQCANVKDARDQRSSCVSWMSEKMSATIEIKGVGLSGYPNQESEQQSDGAMMKALVLQKVKFQSWKHGNISCKVSNIGWDKSSHNTAANLCPCLGW